MDLPDRFATSIESILRSKLIRKLPRCTLNARRKLSPLLFLLLACSFLSPQAEPPTPGPAPQATAEEQPTAPPTQGGNEQAGPNLALNASVSASQSLPGYGPEKAVDGIAAPEGDSLWNSGGSAPQWIEIDLGAAYDVTRIRLVASQDPAGEVLHLVLGRRPGETETITIGQIAGAAQDQQEFILSAGGPWNGIRTIIVQTFKSPSWVAWREIEVFGAPAGASAAPTTEPGPAPLVAADLIFTGANILTMDPDLPQAAAIAIKGDKILAVGTDAEVLHFRGDGTRVIDLAGWTILPGFIDSHTHRIGDRWLYGYGEQGPEQVIQEAIEGGWTSLHEMFVHQDRLHELTALAAAGVLRVRVSMYLTMNFHYDRDDWWTAYQPLQQYGPNLQIAGLKITLDQEWGETVFFDQAQLTGMVRFGADRGWQIATHAFTPQTDLMILNAYAAAIADHPEEDFRFRLEHIGVINDEGIQKMAELGVLGSVQFLNTAKFVEDATFIEYIPEAQWPLVSRWRDLIDAGVLLVGNVDAPWCCTPWRTGSGPSYTAEAMDAVYQAVTRTTYDGRVPEPWQASQVLSVAEALELLTIRGAYAAHQEHWLGSLEPGKFADLVVLSADPLAVPAEQIPGIEILMTMIAGRAEYCPPGQVEICP